MHRAAMIGYRYAVLDVSVLDDKNPSEDGHNAMRCIASRGRAAGRNDTRRLATDSAVFNVSVVDDKMHARGRAQCNASLS